MTLVSGGEGLPGEAPQNVVVPYVAEVFSGSGSWTGDSGSSWGGNGNWTDSNGSGVKAAPGTWGYKDTATFSGSGSVTAIDLTGVNPTLLALNFSKSSYTLSNGSLTLNGINGPATVTVSSGTQSIDTPITLVNNVTFAINNGGAMLLNSTVSGFGYLTKGNSGTLILAGSKTYTGPTTINQGLLAVNGSLHGTATVNSGGTLSGTGYLSSVTVTPSGQLAPGSPLGVMNVSGSLNLESGAVMDYELDTPSTSSEVLMPTGQLILSGQQFTEFDFTPSSNFGPGSYVLIAVGSINGSLGASNGTIDGFPATLSKQGNEIALTVVPEPSTLRLLAAGVLARSAGGAGGTLLHAPGGEHFCARLSGRPPCPHAGQRRPDSGHFAVMPSFVPGDFSAEDTARSIQTRFRGATTSRGGARTRTSRKGHRILNPVRLPISPDSAGRKMSDER